jgi:hypothetical protein
VRRGRGHPGQLRGRVAHGRLPGGAGRE